MAIPAADAFLTDMAAEDLTNGGSAYEEIAQIGTGAFGTVYKARDRQNEGRFVALKKVRVSLNEEGIPSGTLREIGLLRQLDALQHPNVVRLLDICHGCRLERELVLFLVFEHIDQDLAGFLERCPDPGLEPALIASLLKQLLTGVEFLHSHRIVHRDLKPQNVLVTAQRQLKLADFGLARLYEQEMSLTPVVVTLWYRPPEVPFTCIPIARSSMKKFFILRVPFIIAVLVQSFPWPPLFLFVFLSMYAIFTRTNSVNLYSSLC